MSGWISVEKELPKCSMVPDSFGVPVLIAPTTAHRRLSDFEEYQYPFAYYGMRVKDEPCFYLHGKELSYVTDWQPLPPPPK